MAAGSRAAAKVLGDSSHPVSNTMYNDAPTSLASGVQAKRWRLEGESSLPVEFILLIYSPHLLVVFLCQFRIFNCTAELLMGTSPSKVAFSPAEIAAIPPEQALALHLSE